MTNHDRDPVDSALSALRSCEWTGPSVNTQLEERLMKEYTRTTVSRSFLHRPAVAAALGILVLGGGAFAAGGGIEYIKSLFVTVEIDGQPTQLELQPVGDNVYEGTLQTQTQDGRDAHVVVRRLEGDPNEQNMTVNVNLTGDDSIEAREQKIVVRHGETPPELSFTVADLGDAEPAHQWTNAEGQARALYLITDEETGELSIFSTTVGEDETLVRRVAQLPAGRHDGDPKISVDENDLITLVWESGEGELVDRQVIRLMDRNSAKEISPEDLMDLAGDATNVKVRVDSNE